MSKPAWERDPVPPRGKDAGDDPVVLALREDLGEAVESARSVAGDLALEVRRESLAEVCRSLKERHGFTYLIDLCGAEHPKREPRFAILYHLHSFEAGRRVRLRVRTDEPAAVPSVKDVWRGAGWPEREVHDLFGIRFEREETEETPELAPPRGEEMELTFGPQHPSLQGLLRLKVRLEGEQILECSPPAGPLHRELEKVFETHSFAENVPHTDRLDFEAPAAGNLAYVGAVEKLTGLVPPPRARYIRTLLAELQRISSHLHWLAHHALDIGFAELFPHLSRDRGMIHKLLEDYRAGFCPGGLQKDIPDGWIEKCRAFIEAFPARLDEHDGFLAENRLWKKRTVGVGVLDPEMAIDHGVTGPLLRGSGIAWDLRKAMPYEAYGELDFEVPVGKNGDLYDRYLVRAAEMREANRIVAQCLEKLPEGPILAKLSRALESPRDGEVYHGIEGPKGETGFYLVSDGTPNPARCHVRSPSFMNLQILPELCKGQSLAHLVALMGTLDIALGEVGP